MVALNDSTLSADRPTGVDIEITPLAPRSSLVSLKPIAVGTGMVESLWSYLVRLADAHAVRLHDLFWLVVVPLTTIKWGLSGRFTVPLKGEGARQIIAAVEALTMRTGLERTALLRTERFSCVLVQARPNRAWCPSCLKSDEVPYEPVIWNIRGVIPFSLSY